MADNRSVVITLKLDKGDDDNSVSEQVKTDTGKNDKDKTNKSLKTYAAAQIASLVTSEMVNWGEYFWDRELTLNDDYIGQRDKAIITMQINRGISAGSSIVSSVASGLALSGGNPVGAAIGFVVGLTTQAASIIRSNVQGRDKQNIMLRQMNAQLEFTRSRAGWSTHAASIGEDL